MKIIVSSTASQKIDAANLAFQNSLPNKIIEVAGEKSISGINEQPNGRKEIILGCENRLSHTMMNPGADIYVSMESGIELRGKKWHDLAYIILYFSNNRQAFSGFTDSVVFPTDCVEEAMRLGFDKHTVGSVMATKRPDINKQDPHLSLTGKSRVIYLADGIEKLITEANSRHLFRRLV
jgi:non-canonical (house-cleaning) NTP pyrophosphatase